MKRAAHSGRARVVDLVNRYAALCRSMRSKIMAMKYDGTLSGLKALLDRHDILGSWEGQPNGVHMMRGPDGANLHWASGSKSLWIDGKDGARRALTVNVAGLLHCLDDG